MNQKYSFSGDDGHKSRYDLDFLYNSKYETFKKRLLTENQQCLWDKNRITESNYARVSLNDYICNDHVAKSVVQSLIKYGIAFIEKVPANLQSTEIAVKRFVSLMNVICVCLG